MNNNIDIAVVQSTQAKIASLDLTQLSIGALSGVNSVLEQILKIYGADVFANADSNTQSSMISIFSAANMEKSNKLNPIIPVQITL